MRLEKIISKALENANDDHYKLSIAVAQRAKELAAGAEPLVDMDKSKNKFTDIALHEIAEKMVIIDGFIEVEE